MNPSALKRARELRGLSASALARRLNVSQSIISQIESGRISASPDMTRRVASELDVPVEFLVRPPRLAGAGSVGLFRAHSSKLNGTEELSIRQQASTLLDFVSKLSEEYDLPEVQIPRSFGDKPLAAAERTRAFLGYAPDEPIGNLTARAERLGTTIVKAKMKEDAVFGHSFWANDSTPRPFVLLSHHQTPYRLRWTLAHELGHIVLGHEYAALDPRDADREADRFAGALLVPAEQLVEDLIGGVSLSAFADLKVRYGVSIQSLIRRAYDSGIIEQGRYESMYVQISQKGWRKREPGDDSAPFEEPSIVKQLKNAKYGDSATARQVAYDLGFPEDIVAPLLTDSRTFLREEAAAKLIG